MSQSTRLIVTSNVHEVMLANHWLVFWVEVSEKVNEKANGNHHVACEGKLENHYVREGK